jgi:hypothetical protein
VLVGFGVGDEVGGGIVGGLVGFGVGRSVGGGVGAPSVMVTVAVPGAVVRLIESTTIVTAFPVPP